MFFVFVDLFFFLLSLLFSFYPLHDQYELARFIQNKKNKKKTVSYFVNYLFKILINMKVTLNINDIHIRRYH